MLIALKTNIKKELRGLRKTEQTLQKRTDSDSEILLGYTQAIRKTLQEDGEPPLNGGGTKVYEQIEEINSRLIKCEKKKRS